MIDISKALSIDGWMSPAELTWLAKQAESHKNIVELGSFLGRSTRALGDNTAGCTIAIDDWIGPREVNVEWSIRQTFFDEFKSNLGDLIEQGKVLPLRCDHACEPGLPSGFTPDMVFIDGDHGYEPTQRDINNWKARIKPGGLLCGHDVNDVYVRMAVIDSLPTAGVVPNTNIWAVYV